jgi:hypothetical protein
MENKPQLIDHIERISSVKFKSDDHKEKTKRGHIDYI